MKHLLLLISIYFFTTLSVFAHPPHVEGAYIRAMPPGQKVTGSFMVLRNPTDKNIALVRAESDVAKNVELHEHIHENGMMKMRPVKQIDIKANSKTDLKPGGYHVMLIGLKRELNLGEKVAMTLHFSDGTVQKIEAPVKKISATMGMMKGKGMKHQMSGGMDKMKMMHHANPMPSLMRVIVKKGDTLNLDENQKLALKKWRTENKAIAGAKAKKVAKLESQLKNKALNGASEKDLESLATEVLAIRMDIIKGKIACRDNMQKILNDKQYKQVISLYKAMY